MTAGVFTDDIDPAGAALARTAARFEQLAARSRLEDADVDELALLSANAAHLLTYTEGNQRHFGPAHAPRSGRQRLLDGPEADAALLVLLEGSVCKEDTAERTRGNLLNWLRERARVRQDPATGQVAALYRQARDALHHTDRAQAALLERLGLRTHQAAPATVFYRAVSTATKPSTREKLVRAWEAQRARHAGPVLERLDAVVGLRREQARAEGASSVAGRTLDRSGLDEARAAAFIDAYVERAVDSTGRLATRIRATTGATDHPLAHFGAYARTLTGGAALPAFPLDGCLDYLAAITRDVFGITLSPLAADRPDEHLVLGTADGQAIGTASFDLMETPPRTTRGRSEAARGDAPDRRAQLPATLPEARVLCRYQYDARGNRVVSFESLHSMLHEFGHVMNHWLLRRHTPSETGLDYLPLERIEDLSTWFEKWAYHPRLAGHLALCANDAAGLRICARIKRLEFLNANLDRAVVAALDFDVHRQDSGGLADSFRRLDNRFRLSDLCRLEKVAGYLLSPLCRAYPGANFTYLWGAAFGAEAFEPWLGTGQGACAATRARAGHSLRSCLDPDAPSQTPKLDPLFLFYDADGEPCL
ncbi:M3 family metallopeptidase [Streptomyces scopuliridis]|uniref:M3 family metallopeptidase n=1 Tax=Streptomyces scopuliridis TaxID=452529 RepID=A0ACD4ZCV9_9ACTN|nr:M3 family metallopeptidase [Streptomyces scopuliridis]WSB95631.1 M3 family metallopeptidase [Streptomyces scopuliridis]WSC10660.1 M3 family metallopeptidase [Streptomyces scopuliridis]